ncbi:glycosyltransferase family A protein [Kitasatospora sp. GP82]|uniref:glycosyltransferase family 2 protein n=1 Tax=Kitasatospora sp. GP82 TaxID=3035089 RepID=UPI002476966C|nr:glycosyltransferase family A protein [Kitasatospora sp. GP82]
MATVIPTYRRPEGLRRAVESALAQTVKEQVVIVVDDGARPPELLDDPRLFAVSPARNVAEEGVVRNVGIRLGSSRYVAFLDDDSEWKSDHLARAVEVLSAPGGPDAVCTALRRLHPGGSEMDVLSVPFDRRRAAEEGFLDANAVVARRARALRFSRLRRPSQVIPCEDRELVFRYSRTHRIGHLPVPTVRYLVNPDGYWFSWAEQQA